MLRSVPKASIYRSARRHAYRAFSSASAPESSRLPLSGTRILDLTRVLAGVCALFMQYLLLLNMRWFTLITCLFYSHTVHRFWEILGELFLRYALIYL